MGTRQQAGLPFVCHLFAASAAAAISSAHKEVCKQQLLVQPCKAHSALHSSEQCLGLQAYEPVLAWAQAAMKTQFKVSDSIFGTTQDAATVSAIEIHLLSAPITPWCTVCSVRHCSGAAALDHCLPSSAASAACFCCLRSWWHDIVKRVKPRHPGSLS